jgi:hypothetical protein
MTDEQISAIGEFFTATDRLKKLEIIRSDRYLGDIAEFIAKARLGMAMTSSLREPGHDGYIDGKKVQVKFNGGKSITIDVGDPTAYDDLIVILGPNSVMRAADLSEPYVVYRIPSEVVKRKRPHRDGKLRLAKGDLLVQYRIQVSA